MLRGPPGSEELVEEAVTSSGSRCYGRNASLSVISITFAVSAEH